MKKTNTAIKVIGLLFFITLLTYLAVYIVQALDNPFSTALAASYTVRDSAKFSGIIVRDEEVLYSAYNTVYITAGEGKMVSKGGEIASAFNSDADLQKAVRINELKTEIGQLETIMKSETSDSDKLQRETAISENIINMKTAVYSRNFSGLEDKAIQLRTLVFTGSNSAEDIQTQINELTVELDGLSRNTSLSSAKIYASASGLYSKAVDGWEDLNSGKIKEISASELSNLMSETRDRPENALGKLVYGTKWYFASVVKRANCVNLNIGDRVNLLFGRYNASALRMTVESISRAEDGKCAVVFSCDRSMTDILNLRIQEAELIFKEFTGIRVPKKSVHLDEDGRTCVYVLTALKVEKKYVEIVYDLGDFYVVSDGADSKNNLPAEGETENRSLRVGDQIIVSAKKLYDGKVVD